MIALRALALAGGLTWAGWAAAAAGPPVLLELDRCDELNEVELRRIVAAELGAAPSDAGGPEVTRVTVRCSGPRVAIAVGDPLSRKAVQRSFDLGLADPRARARLVAIAATELVLASWAELRSNPHPHVEPEGERPSEGTTRAARALVAERYERYEPKAVRWYDAETPGDRMLRVMAVASARAFFLHPGTLWGGGVRVGEERFRFVSWAADLAVESGNVRSADTVFHVQTASGGGWLMAYLRGAPITARVGAGLRLGVAGASGRSSLAPWGWPLGVACVSVRMGPAVLDLSGEAGYVALPVEGRGESIRGTWFSGQVGLGFVIPQGPADGERAAGAAE